MAGPVCAVLVPDGNCEEIESRMTRALDAAAWPADGVLGCGVSPLRDGPDRYTEHELQQIGDGLGWVPAMQFVCVSMVGFDLAYHRLLAHGAVELAEEFGGAIDLTASGRYKLDTGEPPLEISYEGDANRSASYWVVTSLWLKRWLEHPEFRMPK